MKIGAVAPIRYMDASESARRVRLMDKAGFDCLWLYETYFVEETFSRAGFIAACTERVKIGAGVVNPYTRHPSLLAMAASTLDRLSDGRLILLMGAGAEVWIETLLGYERSIADVVGAIRVIRGMLSGERVTHTEQSFKANNVQLDMRPTRPDVPIYLAAENRALLKVASHDADGVFLGLRVPTGYVRWAYEFIKKSKRRDDGIELGTEFPLWITDNPTKVREELKPTLAYYLSLPNEGERYLRYGGYDMRILEPIREALKMPRILDQGGNVFDVFKSENLAEAARYVPDELVDDCSVIGDPGQCRERLAELEEAGLSFVALQFQPRFDQTMSRIRDILS